MMRYWLFALLFLVACTGSSELEKDYQLIFAVSNQPTATGVLSGCTNPLNKAGGLLRIDSRRLRTQPSGQCQFIATDSPPYDLERSLRPSTPDNQALFVSLPLAGAVQAYNPNLALLWTYPSVSSTLPSGFSEFCPTQLALSSGQATLGSVPSEAFIVVLDDPKDPKSTCTANRDARLVVLDRSGKLRGWINLDFAARVNGQIRIAASESELFLLYADNGSSYRVARISFGNINLATSLSSFSFSDPIPVFSNPSTNLALGYTNTGLLLAIGGSSGRVLPVVFNASLNKVEFAAELRETNATSDFIGATQQIFWNKDGGSNLTVFARERPDVLLRRSQGESAQRTTRNFVAQDGVFAKDSSFWGLSNGGVFWLDVFTFPNVQTVRGVTNLGDANLMAISWLIGN